MKSAELIGHRYQIVSQIGVGGMGAVYRVNDRLTGSTIALKRVTASIDQLTFASQGSSTNPKVALAQEFQVLASLRHPHIVSVLDYGFDEQRQPYYTMTYLQDAKTIFEAGREKPLDVQIRLLAQMLLALAYLHRRGVIHRDLKPGNVMVVDGQVQVVDFGLSLVREQSMDTETQAIAGTLAYMAPEIFEGKVPGRGADLYAIGVMAYELFAGRHPFDKGNLALLVNQVLNTPADLSALAVNGAVAHVVEKLLAKSRTDRYQNANDVIRDLCAAANIPLPSETAAIRESFLQAAKFVRREKEFAQLEEALEDATDDKGSAWLIAGESGVGKTRLLDELRTLALVFPPLPSGIINTTFLSKAMIGKVVNCSCNMFST
jgi:serine/threonine protein kinase